MVRPPAERVKDAIVSLESRRAGARMSRLMGRRCRICGKGPSRGFSITRRGLAKAKGGVGRKITGRTKRSWLPNLQRVRAVIDGEVRRIRVCTTCLRSGRVTKPA